VEDLQTVRKVSRLHARPLALQPLDDFYGQEKPAVDPNTSEGRGVGRRKITQGVGARVDWGGV